MDLANKQLLELCKGTGTNELLEYAIQLTNVAGRYAAKEFAHLQLEVNLKREIVDIY